MLLICIFCCNLWHSTGKPLPAQFCSPWPETKTPTLKHGVYGKKYSGKYQTIKLKPITERLHSLAKIHCFVDRKISPEDTCSQNNHGTTYTLWDHYKHLLIETYQKFQENSFNSMKAFLLVCSRILKTLVIYSPMQKK